MKTFLFLYHIFLVLNSDYQRSPAFALPGWTVVVQELCQNLQLGQRGHMTPELTSRTDFKILLRTYGTVRGSVISGGAGAAPDDPSRLLVPEPYGRHAG